MDAYLSVGSPIDVCDRPEPIVSRLEGSVAEELDAIRAHVAAHGEDAAARWPAPEASLPRASSEASWISHDVERWLSRN